MQLLLSRRLRATEGQSMATVSSSCSLASSTCKSRGCPHAACERWLEGGIRKNVRQRGFAIDVVRAGNIRD